MPLQPSVPCEALGVRRQVMLTGDERKVAEHVCPDLGLDEVRAKLLPEDKVRAVEQIEQELAGSKRGGWSSWAPESTMRRS